MSNKIELIDYNRGPEYQFYCPGCKSHHSVTVEQKNQVGARWSFNYDLKSPTIQPSIKVHYPGYCCHSFVTNGMIQFLSDCTHDLKVKTVELPDIE